MERFNDWVETATTTANTSVTHAAEPGHRHVLTTIFVGFDGTGGTGHVRIEDGSTIVARWPIIGAGGEFHPNFRADIGAAVTVAVTQTSVGETCRVSIFGYTE